MQNKNRPAARSAVVIGGGIVGMSSAIALLERGMACTLIDPATERRGASWGNAGHIAIEQVEPLASMRTVRSLPRRLFSRGGAVALPARDIAAWLPFSLRLLAAARPKRFDAGKAALAALLAAALPAWRRLVANAGAADLLVEDGHFIVWETPQSAAAGRAAWAATDIGAARFRDVTPAEMAQIAALTKLRPAGAIRFLGSGQVADLGELATALDRRFTALGGVRRVQAATALEREGAGVAVRLADGTLLRADAVLVATGARAGELLAPLGLHVPLIAERGYHIRSAETTWPAEMPPLVFEDRSMIVTRFRGHVRAASIVEFSRVSRPADPRKWARLRDHVAALGLPFALPGEEWIGARPTLPDYLPAIGASTRAANLFYAFGHQHLGLTLGPVTGEAIAALIAGETPGLDLAPFDLRRFG
ncbi:MULTISPECIES: FAD-binding oxidoreductase [unclassified Sphingomonas]|uniref:NAD(P)/FAD-dependent oxidoreductase n=1 Tax=unclassified Sphingomonas TaxID=196159 RepID=UPI0009278778|nr:MULTISPECIES: FAD-binding oxidoreductase [unclassified Sphingomonas]OJU15943.1 MAG: FAD-dependent oxidoreductase [Sphingomonas sp. 66-10]